MSQELIFKPGKAKSTLCDEDILLLDQHDRIIGIYPAEGAETELRIGDSLIDAFGIDTFDQGALERARQGAVGLLLMVSAGKPLVVLCHFYAATGLTAVVLPRGEIGQLLAKPAAYFTSLQHVTFSPGALRHTAPVTEKGHQLLAAWLEELRRPFSISSARSFAVALSHLEICVKQGARRFGRQPTCSFSALFNKRAERFRPVSTMGFLTAALLLTDGLATSKELIIRGEWLDPVGPVLLLSMDSDAVALPEALIAISQAAFDRGLQFEAVLT
ncbi:MAG: hypothetical protein IKM08_04560, partial [Clostridia bacterium]|nr:hypothetical protein [Clostridia bacterium]